MGDVRLQHAAGSLTEDRVKLLGNLGASKAAGDNVNPPTLPKGPAEGPQARSGSTLSPSPGLGRTG
jgi:hypothetical protein